TGTTLKSTVVTSSLTSLGTQAQALDMGTQNITNVGTYSGGAITVDGVAEALRFTRGTGTVGFFIDLNADLLTIRAANDILLNDAGGNVAVGIAGAKATLHIKLAATSWEDALLLEHNSGNTGWNIHPENNATNDLWFGYNADTSVALTSQSATAVLKLLGTTGAALFTGAVSMGALTSSGIAIESGSPVLTLKDTNNVLGDANYQSYIRGMDSADAQAWWLGDGSSGVKQASFYAVTGYKLGLYSNDTLVLMLSDSSTLATFSGAVSMGALTATTAQLSKSTGGETLALNDSGAATATDANAWMVFEYNGTEMGRIGHLSTGSQIFTIKNTLNSTVRITANTESYDFNSNSTVNFGTASLGMGALTASGIVHAQGGKLEVGTAASGG
ncbi:hypothetical protein LCGC14_2896740, partial [marine sediment metagenome]